jgi:hypothetical protein
VSDDIERLLAEVSKSTQPSPTSSAPARKEGRGVARSADGKPGGRLPFALISAVVFGGIAFVVGWLFTPFVLSGTSMGLGAAIGSFVTGLIAGPPRWFSS